MSTAAEKSPFARIVEHLGWIISGKGYGAILSLVYLAIVTRSLGPAGYGSFSLILGTVLTLQLMLSFNVWQVLVKYGHDHIRDGDNNALARLIRLCSMIDLATAIIGIVAVALLLLLGRGMLGMDDALAWLTFGYATVFFLSLRSVPRGIFRLKNLFRLTFLAEAVVPTVKLAGALLALVTHASLELFLITWAAGEAVSTLLFWFLAIRVTAREFGPADARHWPRAWRENEGLPALMVASNVGETAYAAGQQLPVLLVGYFAGVSEAGLYRLAHQLAQTVTLLAGFMNLATYTEMAQVAAKGGLEKLRPLFVRMTLTSIGMAAVLGLCILILGKPLIALMAGPAFAGAYPFMLVLGLAAVLQILGVGCDPMLMAAGRARTLIAIRLTGTAVLLAMLFLFLTHFGAIGAAWAKTAAELFSLCLMFPACILILRKRP